MNTQSPSPCSASHVSKRLTATVQLPLVFHIEKLPRIAKLYKLATHTYRKRWTKRLFKRPMRILYDFVYDILQYGDDGEFRYNAVDGPRSIIFNGRNAQFGAVHQLPEGEVYEAPIVALMELLLTDDRSFVDVGANWGCLTLQAAAFEKFSGPIHAFEPVSDTYADLCRTVGQSGLAGRVTCHKLALSSEPGAGFMNVPQGGTSGWAHLTDDRRGEPVQLATLDELNIAAPNLIKIDAEDHEIAVLRGAGDMLRTSKPYIAFENWLDAKAPEIAIAPWRYLTSLNYTVFCPAWITDDGSVRLVNMPPIGPQSKKIALIPMSESHRMFGPQHWSYFACHRDRLKELQTIFKSE